MNNDIISTEKYIIDNSIFRIGKVVEIIGQSVKVEVDTGKNTSSVLYKGEIIQNISVGGYVKIKKGFEEMIGKIEGESISENKKFSKISYSSNKEKIHRILNIKILGFMDEGSFIGGIKELPLIDNTCFLLTKEEFNEIHKFVEDSDKPIEIGKLEYDDGQKIELGINSLFASHIGIFGNTGSGKSYTLAKIYRELFKKFKDNPKFQENAKFFLIDFNGEYIGEVKNSKYINKNVIIEEKYKNIYNLSTEEQVEKRQKFRVQKETLEDSIFWSILLEATEKTQSPFLNDTLNNNTYLDKIFTSGDIQVSIRKEIIEIIRRGMKRKDKKLGVKIFTEMFSKLYNCVEDSSKIKILDIKNLINQKLGFNGTNDSYYCNNISDSTEKYQQKNIESEVINPIQNILASIEFSISDVKTIKLRIMISYYGSIVNGFGNRENIAGLIKRLDSRVEDLDNMIEVDNEFFLGTERAPILNFTIISLKDVKISMRKMIPMLLVKELYDQKKKDNNKDHSLHIIIDEAHNVLSENSERETTEWKDYRLETFEEIIKEGRKFGTFLTIASQRPSDISPTIISQLHNYFLHRLINNHDISAVEKTIAYLDKVSADSIPNLSTGTCILAGLIAQIPVVIKVNKISNEENQPQSQNINLLEKWKVEN